MEGTEHGRGEEYNCDSSALTEEELNYQRTREECEAMGMDYAECDAHCQPNCETLDQITGCPFICKSGCVCPRGTVKSSTGDCVSPMECPTWNPPANCQERYDYFERHFEGSNLTF